MATDHDTTVEELREEVRALRERIAFLEGRRRGTFRTLEVVLPVGLGVLALLGFTAITSRVNALVDQRVEEIVAREVEVLVSPEMVENRLEAAIETAITRAEKAADDAEKSVLEAGQAVIMAESAADNAEEAAVQAGSAVEEAETAVEEVEAVATQAANGGP